MLLLLLSWRRLLYHQRLLLLWLRQKFLLQRLRQNFLLQWLRHQDRGRPPVEDDLLLSEHLLLWHLNDDWRLLLLPSWLLLAQLGDGNRLLGKPDGRLQGQSPRRGVDPGRLERSDGDRDARGRGRWRLRKL